MVFPGEVGVHFPVQSGGLHCAGRPGYKPSLNTAPLVLRVLNH